MPRRAEQRPDHKRGVNLQIVRCSLISALERQRKLMNILVSVIIPTRGRPAFLLRAIDSVLRQTFEQMEIVVVVDGPDEATEEALRNIRDERLRVVALPSSVGGSDARNIGVQNATGEWIAFLDDDDEWMPSKIEKQLALAAQAREPYPVIATQLIAKSPYGDFIWPRRFPGESEPLCEYLFNRKTIFAGEGLLQTSTLLTRRSLMELVPFTSGLTKHQDIDWYVRVSQVSGARFYFVPMPLVNLYVEENRATISGRSDWRFSLNWLKASRRCMSPRAYAGFICSIVASEASKQGHWRAFPELLREMFRYGKPGYMDLSLFVSRWFIRPSIRGKLRALRHSIAVKQSA
jgi:glycosyltransferase involved in cell wall biosynthesis